jgi:hypothetical protein
MKVGQTVLILGKKTVLQTKLRDVDGGWIVAPPVDNCSYWNEQEMKPFKSKEWEAYLRKSRKNRGSPGR